MFSRWLQLILSIITATLVSISDASYCDYIDGGSSSCTDYGGLTIPYPFWIASKNIRIISSSSSDIWCQPYPGFEVKCEGGKPVMNISNHRYYVQNIDHYPNSIRLLDTDTAGQECPQPRHNFSLQSQPFLQLSDSRDLATIFYNCTVDPKIGFWKELPCLENSYHNNKTRRSYAFWQEVIPEGFHNYCEETVVVPLRMVGSNFTEALKSGFLLEWSDPVDCDDCVQSGGQCSANQTTGGIRCQCPGGTTRLNAICPHGEDF